MQSSSARRAAFGASLTGDGAASNVNPPSSTTTTNNQQNQSNNFQAKGKERESSQTNSRTTGSGSNSNRNQNQRKQQPPHQHNQQQQQSQVIIQKVPINSDLILASTDANLEEDDGSQCFICAEPVIYYAVGECDHRTCHTCAIRLRALYKKNACVFCKHECARIVVTASPTLPFTSFPPSATPFSDTKLGISFETREQMDESLSLLRFNCPLPTCSIISLGWSDLKRHAHSEHSSSLCDLCCSFKKIFSHEHTLFSGRELVKHKYDEHMMCDFCNIGFYDADALYAHCRDRHEECFVCVRNGIRHQYHRNYDRLEAHYKAFHFLCPHPTCLEEKFVVFESEIDLQAHAVSKHGASAGDQRARRDARRIETNFSHEYEEGNNGGGGGGSRGGRNGSSRGGRGSSSAGGNGGRERREANGAPSTGTSSTASFITTGDGLSRNRVIPGLAPRTQQIQQTANGRDIPPHSRTPTPSSSSTNLVERGASERDEVLEKHADLMKRVSEMVTSDSKITSFKSAVRGYKGSEMSAEDLVDTLYNVFDRQLEVATGIITGVADLFEDAEKRMNVLSAWQDLRAKQNQFPSLAPLGPAINGIPTTLSTSSQALNNSSTRNNRDPALWARVANAAGSVVPLPRAKPITQREKFPALPNSSSSVSSNIVPGMKGSGSGSGRNTPWMASSTSNFNPSSRANTSSTEFERASSTAPTPTSYSRPTFVTESIVPVLPLPSLRRAGGSEFPSLPSSSIESERRARVRAALSKPDPSIVDREESTDNGGFWNGGSNSNLGGYSGTSTRSGSPEPSSNNNNNVVNRIPNGEGQMQKKKKNKILLSSTAFGRGTSN